MNKLFSPYQGTKPFLFVSYARGDINIMLDTASALREMNYRVWYDEGIPVGTDWPKYISQRVNASSAVLFFLSGKSMVSPNCYSEMVSASQSGKPIICVILDKSAELIYTAISRDGILTADEIETIDKENAPYAERRKSKSKLPKSTDWLEPLKNALFVRGSEEEYVSQVLEHGVLTSKFVGPYRDSTTRTIQWKRPLAAAAALIVMLTALSAGIYKQQETPAEIHIVETPAPESTAKPSIDPSSLPNALWKTVSFPDTQQEKAVRQITGIQTGDIQEEALQAVTELAFCGKTVLQAKQPIEYSGGTWYINSAPVVKGGISDLSLMSKMYYLESLTLINQNIKSVKDLKELQILQHLDISGNPIEKLSLKGGFENLRTLNISHTEIKSLVGISAPETLKTVYVSADMLPMELDADAGYQVLLVK